MALSIGDRLGPYEVVGSLGSGGMGEVYRARDARIKRDVAIKVLHSYLATDEHVERLTREARATGALNHPNILAVYDIGTYQGTPYVVSELLEGESLRQRLDRGPIAYRKAVEYGVQVAQALGAAHAKGIYHRDVKPGNLFLTTDGRVKLLDFGLAKLDARNGATGPDDPTASATNRPGVAMGTVGYMSPEQVLGDPVDERTDIFALGAVLYEMFTAVRAFKRPSSAETMTAILKEDPVDPIELNPNLLPAAADAVRRCLEKNKDDRFQSARDLAYHLRHLEPIGSPHPPIPRASLWRGLIVAGLALGAAVWIFHDRWIASGPTVSFRQLTFLRGRIGGARFASQAVVYSEALAGRPLSVWLTAADGPESRSLGYTGADVLSARSGKLALSLRRRFAGGDRFVGTLAEVPLGGGTPRQLLENVEDADWDPNGTRLAVARSRGQGAPSHLEYPIGRTLYESRGSIHFLRISPTGNHVAFLEDPAGAGSGGRVVVVDPEGKSRILTPDWGSARGLAWSPRGDEIWYTAGDKHGNRLLRAVTLDERKRVVLEAPGGLTIWDTAQDGRVLLTRDDTRRSMIGLPPSATTEQDLSWFDAPGLGRLSSDGKYLLFEDRFGVYLRETDGSPAVKLGFEGAWADDLSPDGQLVLATSSATDHLILVPTGPGDPRHLPGYQLKSYSGARWFPDNHRILANGREEGRDIRSYVMDIEGGAPRPLTDEGIWALSVSSDGAVVAAIGSGRITLWDTARGTRREVPGSEPHDRPVAWNADGRSLWVFRRGEMPAQIYRVDVATGQRQLWRTVVPSDPVGVYSLIDFEITPDGRSYFYTYRRALSELYEVRGLR
jgi:dipeptidyl aminopeptidase/acylaminoacyl peptidase